MEYTEVDCGNRKGQWSNNNNNSAAHGGLRHKALFGSIDKQAPPANVFLLVKNDLKEIREGIEEFTDLALNCEAFFKEKAHFQVPLKYHGG